MEKIDIHQICGKWQAVNPDGSTRASGDDTVISMRIIAEKVNELIDALSPIN